MSFVTIQPEILAAAANDLQAIGSAMAANNAADDVSALTATQFATHAGMYQAVSVQAAAIHEMFVITLGTSSRSYAATATANAVVTS